MKNTKRDEYDHKLFRFIQELRAIPFDEYTEQRKELMKKYGFTKADLLRAYRIIRSIPTRKCFYNGIGLKKDVLNRKESVERKIEKQETYYGDE